MTDVSVEKLTSADIASRWSGVTTTRLDQVVRLLGLCGSEKHVRTIDGRNEYSAAAVGLIERELRSRGYQREVH